MKVKATLICLGMMFSVSAMADELAEANKLLENKAYSQALLAFTKLANAGNAEAQFHLGEMYWYGEAGGVDLPKARDWFTKSAAAGNKEATAALDTMAAREVRRKDIDYWVSGYDGKDLTSGAFNCAHPVIPSVSHSNEEIKRVDKFYGEWQKCYNGFVENLSDALPPGKRIPQDIARLMNQVEYDASIANMDKIYRALSKQGSDSASAIMARYDNWRKETEKYVTARNIETKLEGELAAEQLRKANQNFNRTGKMGVAGSK